MGRPFIFPKLGSRSVDDLRRFASVKLAVAWGSRTFTRLRQHGRTYTFESLWSDYVLVQLTVLRQVLRRFVTQASALRGAVGLPAVAAIEILNEPEGPQIVAEIVDWIDARI